MADRAKETGVSERTLRRRIERFEAEGMEGLFATEQAQRRRLPPNFRLLIVYLKAEYPPCNANEIANIAYVAFGRRPDVRTVRRVLSVEAWPLKLEGLPALPRDRIPQSAGRPPRRSTRGSGA